MKIELGRSLRNQLINLLSNCLWNGIRVQYNNHLIDELGDQIPIHLDRLEDQTW